MKALTLVLTLLSGCATAAVPAQSSWAQQIATVVLQPHGALDAAVPRLDFEAEVTDETVDDLLNRMDTARTAGAEAILLTINSPGGSTAAGARLLTAIEDSAVPVHCLVTAEGYSMAFVALQACRTRGMLSRASLMIHEAWGSGIRGNRYQIHEAEEWMRVISQSLIRFCAQRLGMPWQDLEARIKTEAWWMGPDDALRAHAVDYVALSIAEVHARLRTTGTALPR